MASHFSELALSIAYFPILILSAAFLAILLSLAASIVSFLIFYSKEILDRAADRPPVAGTVFHQLLHFTTLYDFYVGIARRHPTFRLIKPFGSDIITTDPANIEHILRTNFSGYSKGEYNISILKDLLGNGIFAADGQKWRHQRKVASYEFTTRVLCDFSSLVFRAKAAMLARKIADEAGRGAVFDIQDMLMKTTMDSIFKVQYGIEIDSLSGNDDFAARFSKAFDESSQIVFRRFFDVFWKIKSRLNIGSEARLRSNIKVMDGFVFDLIRHKRDQKRRGQENGREDMMSRLLLAGEEDRNNITDEYLRDIILNFMIAGRDTTANTLTWFFYMLCRNPLVQEKIANEIREAMGCRAGESEDVEEFALGLTEQVLGKMQYLHAALTETLRLYPAVPLEGRAAEEDDVLPDGFKVKKGDGLIFPSYAMGRMTRIWGEDTEDFRPERWLVNGTFRSENPFKFVAFNAGPRTCLGKEFAYKQMKILASILLHFFKFKLGDESKIATYKTMLTLQIAKGLPIIAFYKSF